MFFFHGTVPDLIALLFYLAAPTKWIYVFFFKYNMLVKRHSDFLAFGLLTVVGLMGYMELLFVNPSGV